MGFLRHPHSHALLLIVTSIVMAMWGSAAWAWGDLGHKIVCEIAYSELNDQARLEVDRLIAQDSEFSSFSESCTWPDHPRKRAAEHFINMPRDFPKFTSPHCPNAAKCLFTGIADDLEVLRTSADDEEKLKSLKFLGHWVGDLHQPLHVSFEEDRGGNKLRDSGPCQNNLHSVWDGCIIQKKLGTDPRDVARDLLEDITEADKTQWTAVPVQDWANESYVITRPRLGALLPAGRQQVRLHEHEPH